MEGDQKVQEQNNEKSKDNSEKPQLSSEEQKKISALEYNIKNKGETSYYYAHKSKFESKDVDPNAKTITGPGIITGGDPVLLQVEKKEVEVIKEPKQISKYIFYDDDKFAVVKMDLPEDAKDVTEDCLESNFHLRSYYLKINVPNGDPYFFAVSKLFKKIEPSKSSIKIVKNKTGVKCVKIVFAKSDVDEEWTKVSA